MAQAVMAPTLPSEADAVLAKETGLAACWHLTFSTTIRWS